MRKHRNTSSVIWSVILIALGGVFLMDNFNMIDFHLPEHWLSWKLIFVFIAVNHLAKGKIFGGIFWGLVAYVLYFPAFLNQLSVNSIVDLWPLLLIGIGLDMIARRYRTDSEECY
ncbi:MAG: DUF5668 domain-containing protein [Spirosomataceae bacterium]|jgi:hypothetical protein